MRSWREYSYIILPSQYIPARPGFFLDEPSFAVLINPFIHWATGVALLDDELPTI